MLPRAVLHKCGFWNATPTLLSRFPPLVPAPDTAVFLSCWQRAAREGSAMELLPPCLLLLLSSSAAVSAVSAAHACDQVAGGGCGLATNEEVTLTTGFFTSLQAPSGHSWSIVPAREPCKSHNMGNLELAGQRPKKLSF